MRSLLLALLLSGCGGAVPIDDHITLLTEKLQPVADNWRVACNAGRDALELNGQDPTDLMEACEQGWAVFQAVEEYQTLYCAIRGLECGKKSSD